MLMAAHRLKDILLVAVILTLAMMLYLFSTYVGGQRSAVARQDRAIAEKQASIRYLELEFAVRSATVQLERWNQDYFGYQPPEAAQFLRGERQLAALDRMPGVGRPRVAAPPALVLAMPVGPLADSSQAASANGAMAEPVMATAPQPIRIAATSLADRLSILPPSGVPVGRGDGLAKP